jgi:hypothetical protein
VVVAPGSIDPHTRCDAQICRDRKISSSFWHDDEVNGVAVSSQISLASAAPVAGRNAAPWIYA